MSVISVPLELLSIANVENVSPVFNGQKLPIIGSTSIDNQNPVKRDVALLRSLDSSFFELDRAYRNPAC